MIETKNITYCFIIFLLIIGCEARQDSSLVVFRPSFGITPSQLLKEGFIRAHDVDIPIYSKVNKDTTIIYSYNFDNQKLLNKQWLIKFPNSDSLTIDKFFKKHLFFADSFRHIYNKSTNNQRNYIFYYKFHQLYEIKLRRKTNELSIIYFYPTLEE